MVKKLLPFLTAITMMMAMCSCGRDWYGEVFVNRKPVTFRVMNDSGTPLENVAVKSEELDAFDHDLIIDGTHYARTNAEGLVTVNAVFDEDAGYSSLGERTTRFTFTATDYTVFDTILNYWEGTVDIVLLEE